MKLHKKFFEPGTLVFPELLSIVYSGDEEEYEPVDMKLLLEATNEIYTARLLQGFKINVNGKVKMFDSGDINEYDLFDLYPLSWKKTIFLNVKESILKRYVFGEDHLRDIVQATEIF